MRETPDPSELDNAISEDVRAGFYSRSDIIERATDIFEVEDQPPPANIAARVDAALARQRAVQASWPSPTDCDRLDAAFGALERSGITARQNFSCCNTCGCSEIGAEMDDSGKRRGFAFFHMQDTSRAVDGMGVMLSYGAHDGTAGSGVAIGREIAAAITAAGLTCEWDGSFDKRINVRLDWRRRLPEENPSGKKTTQQGWLGRLLGKR